MNIASIILKRRILHKSSIQKKSVRFKLNVCPAVICQVKYGGLLQLDWRPFWRCRSQRRVDLIFGSTFLHPRVKHAPAGSALVSYYYTSQFHTTKYVYYTDSLSWSVNQNLILHGGTKFPFGWPSMVFKTPLVAWKGVSLVSPSAL